MGSARIGRIAGLPFAVGLLAAACLLGAPTAARAYSGSDAEQKACTNDVFRLCLNAIPDEDQIVACLRAKRALLSAPCAEVFASPVRQNRRSPGAE